MCTGLTAYAVAQRTREIGIRVWLRAGRTQLVRELVGQGMRLCLAGTTLGLVGALFLGRFLRTLLFGISATDGLTMVIVIATMITVVVAATYLPAARARQSRSGARPASGVAERNDGRVRGRRVSTIS